MYGKMPGVAFEDYVHAKCIVVWGANPKASSIHHVPYLKEAKRRGAFIVAIDPRRNFSHREIDLHLPVQPGTDVVLALALIRWWLEHGFWDEPFLAEQAINVEKLRERAQRWSLDEASRVTGVKASDIELLARRFGESEPAVVRCGWGPERNRNGGQAIAAILAIPALLGKFGVRGGGYTMSNSGATRSDMDRVVSPVEWTARSVNMSRLGTALLELNDPPLKGLFVYNANPVATVPNQNLVLNGLQRKDLFTVVFEQVMTDTAVYADIVLPATTFLEHHDIRVSYGAYGLGGVRPVVGAVGEARPNAEVFATLGRAMGFDDEAFHWEPDEYMTRVSKHVRVSGDSADTERLLRGEMQRCDFPGPTPVQFESVFPRTPDGKINLTPDALGPNPYEYSPPTDDLPLALVTPASSRLISSTFGESNLSTLEVTVHPADAGQRGIQDRELVRVHNAFGEVQCRLRISERIRPGVVAMAKGAWRKASHNGFTSTALCPDHVNVVGGAACFNDARVEVTALQRS
jgi:anaerobic selenocysteine-containing dehydrogenase